LAKNAPNDPPWSKTPFSNPLRTRLVVFNEEAEVEAVEIVLHAEFITSVTDSDVDAARDACLLASHLLSFLLFSLFSYASFASAGDKSGLIHICTFAHIHHINDLETLDTDFKVKIFYVK